MNPGGGRTPVPIMRGDYMHRIIQMAIGVTVAAMMLLLVMVPVLDGMTQETMHGDDLNEGESYYYRPMIVYGSGSEYPRNNTGISAGSNGVVATEWQIDNMTVLRATYTCTEAGLVTYFGEKGCVRTEMEPKYTDGELTITYDSHPIYLEYETGKTYMLRNNRMIYEDDEYKVYTTTNIWMSLGSWCYSLCPKELATMVGGTKMIQSDGAESICFQYAGYKANYAVTNGTINGSPPMLKYDTTDLRPGTYNALDLDGSELFMNITVLNGVPRYDEIRNGDASITISTASHAKIIELNGFSGDYYQYTGNNNAVLFGGTHMVIVPYEQTWTSEHRDLIMLAPVLMAVALLAGMAVTLYNGTRI